MTNEVITIDKDNYAAMAKVMGMSGENTSEEADKYPSKATN